MTAPPPRATQHPDRADSNQGDRPRAADAPAGAGTPVTASGLVPHSYVPQGYLSQPPAPPFGPPPAPPVPHGPQPQQPPFGPGREPAPGVYPPPYPGPIVPPPPPFGFPSPPDGFYAPYGHHSGRSHERAVAGSFAPLSVPTQQCCGDPYDCNGFCGRSYKEEQPPAHIHDDDGTVEGCPGCFWEPPQRFPSARPGSQNFYGAAVPPKGPISQPIDIDPDRYAYRYRPPQDRQPRIPATGRSTLYGMEKEGRPASPVTRRSNPYGKYCECGGKAVRNLASSQLSCDNCGKPKL